MKISTLIFTCLFATSGFAQVLEIVPEIVVDGDSDQSFYYQFSVKNTGTTEAVFSWEFVRPDEVPTNWKFTICDSKLCYGEGDEKPTCEPDKLNILSPGQAYDFYKVTLNPDSTAGEHTVTFRLIDDCNSTNPEPLGEVNITFNAAGDSSVSDDIDNNNILLYPNPVNDFFHISSDENVASIAMYNIVGRHIQSEVHRTGQSHDVSNLDKGLYLVRILDRNQKTLKVIRLTKE